uniref:protein artichoke-like n=1 Tax=Styela clava TaxID=7725 RepID=UPI001939EBD4|nr:protein artichoke-like [Styela clava]
MSMVVELLLSLVTIFTSVKGSCIKGCVCNEQPLTVFCNEGDMETIPMNVPAYAQEVSFAGNKIKTINSRIFYKGLRITKLDLSSNALTDIADDAFLNVRHTLNTLNLRGNQLTDVPKRSLSYLPLLHNFFLANNNIERLLPRTFESMVNLRHLDLSGNWLEQFSQNAFVGLHQLTHLNLSGNNIAALSASSLRNLNSVIVLDLSDNNIAKIHQNALTHTSFLEILNISRNKLEEIQIGHSGETGRLLILDLSMNKFSSIPTGSLSGMKQLDELYLQKNKIRNIEKGAFESMTKLKTLILSKNVFASIPESAAWKGLKSLQKISLAGNVIHSLNDDLFGTKHKPDNSEMQAITNIDLSKNNISEIGSDVFSAMVVLQTLNLERNYITRIPGDAFSFNPILEELYLGSNHLQMPNFSWFASAIHPSSQKLTNFSSFLQNNPWTCNCKLYQESTDFFNFENAKEKKLPSLDGVICFEPTWLRGRSFSWYIRSNKDHCDRTLLIMLRTLLPLLTFLLIIFLFIKKMPQFKLFRTLPSEQVRPKRIRLDSYKRDKIL